MLVEQKASKMQNVVKFGKGSAVAAGDAAVSPSKKIGVKID